MYTQEELIICIDCLATTPKNATVDELSTAYMAARILSDQLGTITSLEAFLGVGEALRAATSKLK